MTSTEIRKKYLNFFTKRNHSVIVSSSLVPLNDPTTLFTGSGMQPLIPYLLGAEHPAGKRLVNSQKAFRSGDIEDVDDNRHTTFFEMLGNWSLGDYFKKEQLPWIFEFLTDEIGIDPKRLYVTVFIGDERNKIPKDIESVEIWKNLFVSKGIKAKDVEMGSEKDASKIGMQEGDRIFYFDSNKNWWSRSGVPENMPVGEPGGPDSEIFYEFTDISHDTKYGEHCHPNCDCGRFLEIGNSVFMEYRKEGDGTFSRLSQQNVDFGGGLERIVAVSEDKSDIFKIDIFRDSLATLEKLSGKKYSDSEYTSNFRVIVDHLRSSIFLIGDGVLPSNTDQGYFVRRLLRRAVRFSDKLGIKEPLSILVPSMLSNYKEAYPETYNKMEFAQGEINKEEEKFRKTLKLGLLKFEKTFNLDTGEALEKEISGKAAFDLYQTYGFPIELIIEEAGARGIKVNSKGFEQEMIKHQSLSRAGAEQKFKGGLADTSEITTMLHTCTHLMLAGLRKYLGEHVHQAGSNITVERTRFDFTHPEKVEREVLNKVEAYVNEAIIRKCPIVIEQMSKDEAKASGVEGSFWEKYPDIVNVYKVKCDDGTTYSQELCGGPHVSNSGDIKGIFKIKKEESSSAGIRRIKAVLE